MGLEPTYTSLWDWRVAITLPRIGHTFQDHSHGKHDKNRYGKKYHVVLRELIIAYLLPFHMFVTIFMYFVTAYML